MGTRTRLVPSHLRPELAVETFGYAPALLVGSTAVAGVELAARADAVGDALGPTKRLVLIPMSNELDAVVAYLGARRGGHVVALCDPARVGSMEDVWRPDVVVRTGGRSWELHERNPGTSHELHPDLAVLLSTSGTTGSAKCVRLSTANLSSNALAIAESLDLGRDDRAITSLPLHYCYGLSVLHSHFAVGAPVVLSGHSVLDRCFWDAVERHEVTSIAAVPHMLELIERAGVERLAAPSLRRVTVAGGRAPRPTVQRFAERAERHGFDLYLMYGQTEATARMAYLPPSAVREHPTSIGVAVPGGHLDLAPVDGAEPGVGELVYRGENVMMGYATSPQDLHRGGELDLLRTGDLARRGPDGMFEIVGRAGRIAKLFGLRVDLDHLEELLADRGVSAWCVERDGTISVLATTDEVTAVGAAVAELTGVPLHSVTVAPAPQLPRTSSGKPDRSTVAEVCDRRRTRSELSSADTSVAALFGRVLGRVEVDGTDTFVGLGGDSLSYVEASIALERLLGELPADWHTTSVSELDGLAGDRAGDGAGPARWRHVESSLLLRAGAIVLVVASHAGLFRLRGGAHVLLAVAGYNFARFLLRPDRPTLNPDSVRSIARVAIPSSIWLAVLAATTADHHWWGVPLLNSYLGPARWTSSWRYWFVEALVLLLVAATLLTSLGPVRRLDRERPTLVPLGVLAVSLVARFDLVTLGPTPEPLLAPHRVAWCFALGWLIARSGRGPWRWTATAAIVLLVPGFFGEPSRDLVVVVGLLLLTWVPTVPVPRWATAVVGLLAGSSLYVYLTHHQVFVPLAERGLPPAVGVIASFVVGIAVWRVVDPLVAAMLSRPSRRRVPS